MTNQNSTLFAAYATAQRMRSFMTTALAGTFVLAQVVPTYATIDNTATATGTYGGVTASYGSVTKNVPVSVTPSLTVTKTVVAPTIAAGTDPLHTDAGDSIAYTYVVKNTGTVAMNNVTPADPGPTFNGTPGTSALGAYTPASATLTVGASQTFTATYVLSAIDVQNGVGVANGVVNTAGATGTYGATSTPYTAPVPNQSTAKTAITAYPQLTIAKSYVVKDTTNTVVASAALNYTVTYTYVACNTGNTTMKNVQVTDTHAGSVVAVGSPGIQGETLTTNGPLGAGASTDAANNGIWDTLASGACVTFTWVHTVPQSEVDHG